MDFFIALPKVKYVIILSTTFTKRNRRQDGIIIVTCPIQGQSKRKNAGFSKGKSLALSLARVSPYIFTGA
jgi:hypothetical protein